MLALLDMKGSVLIDGLLLPSLNSLRTLCKGTYLITISYVRGLNLFIKSALQLAADYKRNNGFWHHWASSIIFLFLIQELCLHTKLLASPNTSIADFLSKAAEPPPFLVLRNAVALLKVKVCSDNQGFVYIKLWWLRVCHMHIHYKRYGKCSKFCTSSQGLLSVKGW